MWLRSSLWLALVLFGNGPSPLDEAREAYLHGDYRLAILQYREALTRYPKLQAEINFNMAQCWFALDSFQQAEELYEKVLPLLPKEAQARARNNLGIIHDNRGSPELALEQFREALVLNPDFEPARYNYELIKRRQPDDPPPSVSPPPPPPPPVQQPPPDENDGNLPPTPELSLQEAETALRQLRQREEQYLQQVRLSNKERKRSTIGKPW